jgi:nucleotide-binding universal stress UspA family protein
MPTPAADSGLKSLVVHVDAGPHAEARLRLARSLAQDHGAALTAYYAVGSEVAQMPPQIETAAASTAYNVLQELDQQRRRVAAAMVDRLATEAGAAIAWEESTWGDPAGSLARRALLADAVVIGQRDPGASGGGIPTDLVESVVIDSGTPALVVPYVDTARTVGQCVVVTWKKSRASAHALRASLPFLTRAREVHLVSWGDDSAKAALAFLRHHGVEALLDASQDTAGDLGGRLLSRVADVSADLLVMGCYGHSRVREFVMGGVSRTILEEMTVPVLMAH